MNNNDVKLLPKSISYWVVEYSVTNPNDWLVWTKGSYELDIFMSDFGKALGCLIGYLARGENAYGTKIVSQSGFLVKGGLIRAMFIQKNGKPALRWCDKMFTDAMTSCKYAKNGTEVVITAFPKQTVAGVKLEGF